MGLDGGFFEQPKHAGDGGELGGFGDASAVAGATEVVEDENGRRTRAAESLQPLQGFSSGPGIAKAPSGVAGMEGVDDDEARIESLASMAKVREAYVRIDGGVGVHRVDGQMSWLQPFLGTGVNPVPNGLGKVAKQSGALVFAFFQAEPEDGTLLDGMAQERLAQRDSKGQGGGEGGLAALGLSGKDSEVGVGEELVDDEVQGVFRWRGVQSQRWIIYAHIYKRSGMGFCQPTFLRHERSLAKLVETRHHKDTYHQQPLYIISFFISTTQK